MSIYSQIRSEINDYIDGYIEPVEGYSVNQYDIIKRIHLYLNSRFEDDTPYNGREKLFFNIVRNRRDAIARFLNIDTKEIRVMPRNPKSRFSTMFLEKELKYWLKKSHFDEILNDVAEEVVTYGSVVLRKNKDNAEIVDIRNLFIDPTVSKIQDSRFITTKYQFSASELRKYGKEKGWDLEAIERIIRKKREEESKGKTSYDDSSLSNSPTSTVIIDVYERFGEVDGEEFDGTEDVVRSLYIVAEPEMEGKNIDTGEDIDMGEVLYKGKWSKDYPFLDFHFSKEKGRWLGKGVVEIMFEAQERINELVNQRRVSMELSAMHIFQTADATIVDNVLSDLRNGDILKYKMSKLEPLINEERNLPAFQYDEDRYIQLADNLSFANDLVTGGELPASTPATNAVIQNNNVSAVMLFKREQLGIFYQKFLEEFALPQALKDMSEEHMLRYVGEGNETDIIDDEVVKIAKLDYIIEKGGFVSPEELMAQEFKVRNALSKNGKERWIKVKKGLYDDLKFEFDVVVVPESVNLATLAQNIPFLIQAYAQAKQFNDPVIDMLVEEQAQILGIDPSRIELAKARRKGTQDNPQEQVLAPARELKEQQTESQVAQADTNLTNTPRTDNIII